MKRFVVSASLLLVTRGAPVPQSDRFAAALLRHRYSLVAREGQLSGSGALPLNAAIADSRFVMLGEDHGATQTPELMAALCGAIAPQKFSAIAIEEGPLVAAELETRARRSDGAAQLASFGKAFPDSIGVYNAREEADALRHCAQTAPDAFHLWGLNQEGLNGAGLILSRVLAERLGTDAREAMQRLAKKNDEAYQHARQSGSIFDFFMIAADEKELASAAAVLEKDGNPRAEALFASLIESHTVNRAPPVEYPNARRRERLMKKLFAANYTRAATASPAPPKVLLRFGAYHLYRGLNPAHGSGIGNYVAEFAEAQGAQSLHIRMMPVKGSQPIHPKVGEPQQLRAFNYAEMPPFKYMQPIFDNLLASDWTMFDLRPLRREWNGLGVRDRIWQRSSSASTSS
jgi:hypothetical protein